MLQNKYFVYKSIQKEPHCKIKTMKTAMEKEEAASTPGGGGDEMPFMRSADIRSRKKKDHHSK